MQKKSARLQTLAELQPTAEVSPVSWFVAQLRAKPRAPDALPLLRQLIAFGQSGFGYVASIDVSQLLDYHRDPRLRAFYHQATCVVAANRVCGRLISWLEGTQPAVSSSTAVFESVLERVYATDKVVFIGGAQWHLSQCISRYGLSNVYHYPAPTSALQLEDCLQFVERISPFRYCFLAVDVRLRERIALLLRTRGKARGLTFCLGHSLG